MRRTLLTLGVVTITGFLGTRALSQTPAASSQLALVGGNIYTSPTEQPIRDGAVLIDGGKIVSVGRRAAVRVPQGAIVIDTTESTITAGFWNSHVHFLERMWSWMDRYGKRIRYQFYRLGASADWDREKFTMDPGPSRAVRTIWSPIARSAGSHRSRETATTPCIS